MNPARNERFAGDEVASPDDARRGGVPGDADAPPALLSRRQAIGGGIGLAAVAAASARWLADTCVAGERSEGGAPAASAAGAVPGAAPDGAARARLAAPVGDVIDAAKVLSAGLTVVAGGLAAAEGALAPLRDGVARSETLLAQLEAALADLGVDVEAQAPAVRHLFALLSETIEAVRDGLLEPLRASWLPDDGSAAPAVGIEAGLFDPLHRRVLEPGAALVAAAAALSQAWRDGARTSDADADDGAATAAETDGSNPAPGAAGGGADG